MLTKLLNPIGAYAREKLGTKGRWGNGGGGGVTGGRMRMGGRCSQGVMDERGAHRGVQMDAESCARLRGMFAPCSLHLSISLLDSPSCAASPPLTIHLTTRLSAFTQWNICGCV